MKGSKIGDNIAVGTRLWKRLRMVTEGAIVASIPGYNEAVYNEDAAVN